MDPVIPPKLRPGDTVRVIAPSMTDLGSNPIASRIKMHAAQKRLESLGLHVTYGDHLDVTDALGSASVEDRVRDLHDAFTDPSVRLIMALRGGWNANQVLSFVDYDLIASHPKALCGFSDITAITNAVYARTGLVTYCGPNFRTLAAPDPFDYTLECFRSCLFLDEPYAIAPGQAWHDESHPERDLRTQENPGYWVINEGSAEGTVIGGNQCTLNLLQGTPFMPPLEDAVLFLEEDQEAHPRTFDRDLQSLIHQEGFERVRGMVLGRFQHRSSMTPALLREIIRSKRELHGIPVIANADFGHTHPLATFPIGGAAAIVARGSQASITVTAH